MEPRERATSIWYRIAGLIGQRDIAVDIIEAEIRSAQHEVLLEASWSDDKSIDLTVVDAATKNAKFDVMHTLAPHITIYIDAFGLKLTY